MTFEITATIVLYKEEVLILKKTIESFLKTPLKKKLFLVDNSPTNILEKHFKSPQIEYIFVGKNIGFGKAHNLVLSMLNSHFHLILNPDVEFNEDAIPQLIQQLQTEKNTSFISPKILYSNNNLQYICRRHPTFLDLINRKLKLSKKLIFKNEYRNQKLGKSFYPDFIHGCFMLFKTKDLKDLKGFDERYFLYMEDADICREIDKKGNKIMYFPFVEIIHVHRKGSSKKIRLFFRHTSSAIKYFLKWGI